MKILFVHPEYIDVFNFKIVTLFGKKASYPPLGLLTVAALVPETWEKRFIDMRTDVLNDEDIIW
ncbi:MAG: B12-binding domain-containing radical SAM protein, partial [Candidatus Omnitrophota bacterium]